MASSPHPAPKFGRPFPDTLPIVTGMGPATAGSLPPARSTDTRQRVTHDRIDEPRAAERVASTTGLGPHACSPRRPRRRHPGGESAVPKARKVGLLSRCAAGGRPRASRRSGRRRAGSRAPRCRRLAADVPVGRTWPPARRRSSMVRPGQGLDLVGTE